ncbi:uncharacterized protein AC631_01297 [Debaryomyces fabryi]|uniref:Membrane insertase YidC/Oxa/ALB C-terminal domain-containing protein n=1 Tax=Debaryomyces fabryi TaxID=58627 RepID=A0A0V1Q332_9ASCO|nr:uncharacterized protein AC631_01297 [Debaryomyces fabryi]KSA02932.1 hypothetical protein AC631_01297 [Debaryomyces fabryi]CUM50894.1 unnamed protein product [Debaryomyces fabryi]
MFRSCMARSQRSIRIQNALKPNILSVTPVFLKQNTTIRFNSTKSSEIADKVSEIKNELTSFDHDVNPTGYISDMTSDQLGYLDSIGLAQGYGPTALIERLLEYSHVYTGLPWWATIILTTAAVRSVMFPLYVKASINGAKMAKIKPELDQVMKELREAENPQEQVQAAHKRKALMKDNDVHMSHQMFPVFQLPIAYGFFQGLRKMANHPVEGFSTQGNAWFEDLTQVDPYCGLQIISAAVVISMVRLGGETGAAAMNPMMKKVMTYVPILSIFITKELSAAVVLYFAANAIFSFIQALVLRNKYFRKFAKMPPIVPPSSIPGAKQPPATVSEWWKEFNQNMNQNVGKKMKESNTKLGAIHKRKNEVSNGFIKKH